MNRNTYITFIGVDMEGDFCIYVKRGRNADEYPENAKYVSERAIGEIAQDLQDRLNSPKPTPAKGGIVKAFAKVRRFIEDEAERREASGLSAGHQYIREVSAALRAVEQLRETLTTPLTQDNVTLWFENNKKAESFAAEAGLCMIGHAEFCPANLLALVAGAKKIRLGEPALVKAPKPRKQKA